MRILFVCTGNTCRSPMAAEVARLLFGKLEMEGFEALSAGLYAQNGARASAGAQGAIRLIQGDLSGHRARYLTTDIAGVSDLILCMTWAHKQEVIARAPEAAGKVYTLCEFAGNDGDIGDPYGGDLREYEECLSQIGTAVRGALKRIKHSDHLNNG